MLLLRHVHAHLRRQMLTLQHICAGHSRAPQHQSARRGASTKLGAESMPLPSPQGQCLSSAGPADSVRMTAGHGRATQHRGVSRGAPKS